MNQEQDVVVDHEVREGEGEGEGKDVLAVARNSREMEMRNGKMNRIDDDEEEEEEEEEKEDEDEEDDDKAPPADLEAQSYFTALTTYSGYLTLITFGHMRDWFGKTLGISRYMGELVPESAELAPLVAGWENFYTRRLFNRIQDCWNRPICSRPGAHIDVVERISLDNQKTMVALTTRSKRCLNLGSYNYLGFADDWETTCGTVVRETLNSQGVSVCSSRLEGGTHTLHLQVEKIVANFVGKPDSVVFSMGYGTNSTTIPSLAGGTGSLIISDALNHTSIVNGCRASGSVTRTFKHNSPKALEKVLRNAIAEGQKPGANDYIPWKKIIVIVEGIYSMEGEVCKLRSIVDVCKKYKAYIFVDEAHSIGALGKTGRGVCEHTGVDPSEVDILMGTFTKSFGAMGGYIASSKDICDHLRATSPGYCFDTAMSPTLCTQVIQAFRVIKGEDGTTIGQDKLDSIKSNANMFRKELKRMGCGVLGDNDSPVIPLLLYHPTKIAAFSRECLKRNLAVVVVGFPAVPIYGSRARFCISAAHEKEDLKKALKSIKEVVKVLNLRYEKSIFG